MKSSLQNRQNSMRRSEDITVVYECSSVIELPGENGVPETATVLWLVDSLSRQFRFRCRELIPGWEWLSGLDRKDRLITVWSYLTIQELPMVKEYLGRCGYPDVVATPVPISHVADIADPDYDAIQPTPSDGVGIPLEIEGLPFNLRHLDEYRETRVKDRAERVERRRQEGPVPSEAEDATLQAMMEIADGIRPSRCVS